MNFIYKLPTPVPSVAKTLHVVAIIIALVIGITLGYLAGAASIQPQPAGSVSGQTTCQPPSKELVTVTRTTTSTINGAVREWLVLIVSEVQVGPEVQPPSQFTGPKAVARQGDVTMEVTLSDRSVKRCDVLWLNARLQGPPDDLWGSSELTVLDSKGSKVYGVVLIEHMPMWSESSIPPPTERVVLLGWRAGPPGYPYDVPYLTDVTPGHYTLVLTRSATDVTLRIEAAFDVVE